MRHHTKIGYEIKGRKKHRKRDINSDIIDDDVSEKKPMKTACAVVKRIIWDPDLSEADFIVGYMDRFNGIEEKEFSSLNWDDVTSTDPSSLALPEHRIHYFKYRGEKVWDKKSRLDNVFGSTGSGIIITDIIHTNNHGHEETDVVDKHTSDEENSSSEPELLSAATGISAHMDNVSAEGSRPNYFVALRITDEAIIANVKEVQDYIVRQETCFRDCCFASESLHVTLFAVRLDGEEQVERTKSVLESCRSDLRRILRDAEPLKLNGLCTFFNKIVYAKVGENETFIKAVDHVRFCLDNEWIATSLRSEVFTPHMTIMNLSKGRARAISKKYIPPWLYSTFSDKEFGSQKLNNMYFCEMGLERQEDGFYKTQKYINLE